MLVSAPVLMVVVSLFERRWGAVVAGTVAAAPFTALIGLLLVSSNLGRAAGVEMALSMSGYSPAQVGFAVVVIGLVRRIGFAGGLAAGTAAFAALAWASLMVPVPVAVLASVLVLAAALRMMSAPDPAETDGPATPGGTGILAMRAIAALVTAAGLLAVADQFGPAAGGAVGAYPVFTVTLSAFLYVTAGAGDVQRVLFGMVHGLPAYLTFVLMYGLLATPLGVVLGGLVAILACSTCYVLPVARAQRRSRVSSADPATTGVGAPSSSLAAADEADAG